MDRERIIAGMGMDLKSAQECKKRGASPIPFLRAARSAEKTLEVLPRYDEQIRNIEGKLSRGIYFIKRGHRVRDLNINSLDVEVPLSEGQRDRLQWNLEVLLFRRENGRESAYCVSPGLPIRLRQTNPNHS